VEHAVTRDRERSPELHPGGLGRLAGARQTLLAQAREAGVVVVTGDVDERSQHRHRLGFPACCLERRGGPAA